MKLCIDSKRLFRQQLYIIAGLIFLSIVVKGILHFYKSDTIVLLNAVFNVDDEHNVPTLYAFLQIEWAALLCFMLAKHSWRLNRLLGKYWLFLGSLMAYAGVDELETLHEQLSALLQQRYQTSGIFYFAWVIPAGLLVLICGIVLLRLLWLLPRITRRRLIIAGCIYVGGAIGGDIAGGWYISTHGDGLGWPYIFEYHVEECMEMVGIAFFTYSLLQHVKSLNLSIAVEVI